MELLLCMLSAFYQTLFYWYWSPQNMKNNLVEANCKQVKMSRNWSLTTKTTVTQSGGTDTIQYDLMQYYLSVLIHIIIVSLMGTNIICPTQYLYDCARWANDMSSYQSQTCELNQNRIITDCVTLRNNICAYKQRYIIYSCWFTTLVNMHASAGLSTKSQVNKYFKWVKYKSSSSFISKKNLRCLAQHYK